MKIIVSIIASDNFNYTEFKDVWVKYIKYIKNTVLLSEIFDFYFLYSDKNGKSCQVSVDNKILYTDFYDNNDIPIYYTEHNRNITKSILNRTGVFYQYIKHVLNLDDTNSYLKYKNEGLYFIRTNLSTLFDLNKLYTWIENKPRVSFFGGSFNGFYNNLYTTVSGTNMIFSLDIMIYISTNYSTLDLSHYLEDEAISQLIIQRLNVFLINIKRLDFIEMNEVVLKDYTWPKTPNSIIYHKTNIGDTNVFSFRFKTFNREHDIKVMNSIVENMTLVNFNLTDFVNKTSKDYNLQISQEAPTYGKLFSESTFKIINLNLN
jgi:hypothetical protein